MSENNFLELLVENDFDHTNNEDNLELLENIFSLIESPEIDLDEKSYEITEFISWAIVSQYRLNFGKKEDSTIALRCADSMFKIMIANKHLQIPYFVLVRDWFLSEYSDARLLLKALPDPETLTEFLNLEDQKNLLLPELIRKARKTYGIEEPNSRVAPGPLRVEIDRESYSLVGKYRFAPNTQIITYDNRPLKPVSEQLSILIEYLIDSYAKGFGVKLSLARDILIDSYYRGKEPPRRSANRDWFANSAAHRFCYGEGKLFSANRSELKLNPHWVPPESAFQQT